MNRPAERAKTACPCVFGGGARPDKRPDRGTRARFSGGLAVVPAKARFRVRCDGTVQAHRGRAGGARQACHAGGSLSTGFIGAPQHGQGRGAAGLGAGGWKGPTNSGRQVWKAPRSRLSLAAGWQPCRGRAPGVVRGASSRDTDAPRSRPGRCPTCRWRASDAAARCGCFRLARRRCRWFASRCCPGWDCFVS